MLALKNVAPAVGPLSNVNVREDSMELRGDRGFKENTPFDGWTANFVIAICTTKKKTK